MVSRLALATFLTFIFVVPPRLHSDTQAAQYRIRPAHHSSNEYTYWIRKVMAWQLADSSLNSGNNWHHGTLYAGIMAAYEATREPEYLNAALNWAEQYDWQLHGHTNTRHGDHHACAQTYLELYLLDKKDPIRYQDAKQVNDYIVNNPVHFGCDISSGSQVWWWCDALFMHPPVLARLGYIFDDDSYIELMHMMWLQTQDCLYDSQEKLFYRDIRFLDSEVGGKGVFWSRGNGWVVAGIARTLQYLPVDDPRRGHYETLLEEMAWRLIELQQPDGFWYANLLYPEQFDVPESSGTAFFCYALAWGINNNILDAAVYGPAVEKAWQALKSAVHVDGMLGWVQPVGYEPRASDWSDTHVYGVGGFLLAASEMQKYNKMRAGSHIDYFETYTCNAALKDVWSDGTENGSTAYIELGSYGDKFMSFHYNNNLPPHNAYTYRQFDRKDLSCDFFNTLSVQIQGKSENSQGQFYIDIHDEHGQNAAVYVAQSQILQSDIWHEISFDLSAFENIDLSAITQMRIGVASSSGLGTLKIDTLRLYPTRCYEPPRADFTGNCRVDMADLAVLASEWMHQYNYLVEPVKPDQTRMAAQWNFDETEGQTAFDAVTGQTYSGTLHNLAQWAPQHGRSNGSVRIQGHLDSRSRVSIPAEPISLNACTIAMWVKPDSNPAYQNIRYLFGHTGLPPWQNRIQLYMDNFSTNLNLGLGDSHDKDNNFFTLPTNAWTHVALVLRENTYAVYINGKIKAEGVYSGLETLQDNAHIGNNGGSSEAEGSSQTQGFNGWIDEVRIYNAALTPNNILYLAQGQPYYSEKLRPTDLSGSGHIGTEDLGIFVEDWQQSDFWPASN